MDTDSGPVRWGPNGAVVGGDFIVVREEGPIKWGHNGDGVVELIEFDDDKLREEGQQFEKDRKFLEAHLDEWHEQYPDMYVVVYQEELIGASPNSKELAEKIHAKGIRPGVSYWRFLSTERVIMIPTAWKVIE